MIPRLLEYEDGRVKVTAEAYVIPEIKMLIDKYDMKVEPYLAYVHAMAAPDSQYINIPSEEKSDAVIYDLQTTLGEFEFSDPMLANAIEKFRSLYMTKMFALAEELGDEIDRLRMYLKTTPIIDGTDGNLRDRMTLLERIEKIAINYEKVKEKADKELKVATKGDHELGEY